MTGSDAAALEFRLLGPVEAVRNGSALPLGGPRQRALLALLLLEPGRPLSADRLAEELWPGRPPPGASTLPSYVSRLRRVLGAEAEITGGASGYALQVAPEWVDALRFQRLLEEGERALARGAARRAAERLSEGLSLWRGRPFAELADEGALKAEAERLEELGLRCLEERIEAELQLGQAAELVEELEALVSEQPYRERLWAQLMLALYRAGRQADALAAYRRARALLDEELGLEPGEELKRLEQAILRHEVEAVTPPEERHNLPAPVTSFVGREAELQELERLLAQGRLVTLTGVGGGGKTRLALEAARRALPDFADGACFVDFSALADPELVPRQLASALALREQADVSLAELLVARLREAELLLLLDNCEHMRKACAELAERLLSACPRLRVLATSREPLGLPGEPDYPVPPLALPGPEAAADELRSSEAVFLFLARAREARPRLRADEQALAAAARICSDLDGLPLALELAAARAKALSLEEIAGRLSDRFRFLVSWRRLAPARHRTLKEAMDWSYELLTDQEQALLARLSVFAGGFTLQAAAAVCLDGDEERALELTERLVEASLVVAEEREGQMRYRLLETVRQYAGERLAEAGGEAVEVRRSHALYFGELAEEGFESAADSGEEMLRMLAWFDAERDNLRAAADYAERLGDVDAELCIVGNLWRCWWVRGSLAEGRARTEEALARGRDADPARLARAYAGAAGLAWALGDNESARRLATAAVPQAVAAKSAADEIGARNTLGVTALSERDFETARRHFEQAVAIAEPLGRRGDALAAKLNLGVVALDSGEFEAAIPLLEAVLSEHRSMSGSFEGIGFAALNLGLAAYRLGDRETARDYWEKARAAFAEVGFRAHVGHASKAWQPSRRAPEIMSRRRACSGAQPLRSRTSEHPKTTSIHRFRSTWRRKRAPRSAMRRSPKRTARVWRWERCSMQLRADRP